MKILLTHRYFWPDTPPYGLMLRSIAEGLKDDGHIVSIFASKPSYRSNRTKAAIEQLDGLDVKRAFAFSEINANILIRFVNVILYCFGLFIHILKTRPDVVTAATFPPVVAAWVASFAAKIVGAKFIYHIQDIHPEVSNYSGGLLGSKLFSKLFTALDNQTLRRSSAIIVLSQDMAETLNARGISDLPIHIVNNFALEEFSEASVHHEAMEKPDDIRRIIFAGNLGRFQNLSALADGIVDYLETDPSAELMFLGDGVAAKELKQKWSHHKQVKFLPFVPYDQAKAIIKTADVGLVSLREDIYRVSYPSKMLTYLGLNVPVFVLVEANSALAKLVVDEGLGAVPVSSDVAGISSAMKTLFSNYPSKQHVAKWHEQNGTASVAIAAWKNILKDDV